MKKFLLLTVLVFLLSSCAINTNKGAKKENRAAETEYHFFFDKFFRDEELTEDEKKRYEGKVDEIIAFFTNTMKIKEQCVEKAKQIDEQFSDKHLGKNSIVYVDSGANGVQYNTRLMQAIKSFTVCVKENEENIKEIAIYNKFVYDALLAEYNAGIRVFQEKEVDGGICDKAELNSEQKIICEIIDKNYLIGRAKEAYAISPNIQERKKTKKEIDEEMDNFTKVNKQIQELEGLN
jgi:hypothetical protein